MTSSLSRSIVSVVLFYMHLPFQLVLSMGGSLLECSHLSTQCDMLVLVVFQFLQINLHTLLECIPWNGQTVFSVVDCHI